MEITEEKTVAEVVTENIKTAHVFKKHGIDFCCGGGISIEKACKKHGVDYSILEKELVAADTVVSNANNYDNWELSFLIDHILNIHHAYVIESIPIMLEYAHKVANVHGEHHPEVIEINYLVTDVAQELLSHMKKEETILFPYVKQLDSAINNGTKLPESHFGNVNNPIQVMEHEHENAGSIFRQIAVLTNNYTTPEYACNTFKALYAKLEEFELDLHQHIHLENNILFPKAIKLEQQTK